ncbi:MAG: DUF2461 domain-containing protein [Prevotella sp.]|nr:DUF2461 domain-containing protein [Prevotella sp.]
MYNTPLILDFLCQVAGNNNRAWFNANKAFYLKARMEFEHIVADAIARLTQFDSSIAHVKVSDATYRFYRDTRFSSDKSPYKRHLGAYIASHGKKALHGGYYIHLEPGHCLLATGNYWLPTNILVATRNEIMANRERWDECVKNPKFLDTFGIPGEHSFEDEKGFGLSMLKTAPAGFPRDDKHIQYLRMKDYCAWTAIPDDFFEKSDALDRMADVFLTAKPMMDFVNAVIDDYE